jgi:hypothetical protein
MKHVSPVSRIVSGVALVLLLPALTQCGAGQEPATVAAQMKPAALLTVPVYAPVACQSPPVCLQAAALSLRVCADPAIAKCMNNECVYRLNMTTGSNCICIGGEGQECTQSDGTRGFRICQVTATSPAPITAWSACGSL